MPRRRHPPRTSRTERAPEPFADVAEAWFWYMACHQARLDGARVVAGRGDRARPCEPADIHGIVLRLFRAGDLGPHHLRTLVRYGRMMLPPEAGRPEHARDHDLWQEALARLHRPLAEKGIVA